MKVFANFEALEEAASKLVWASTPLAPTEGKQGILLDDVGESPDPVARPNACSRGLGWNIPKNTKGRDVSLLIKAVIATARDIATAVDSASLLPQAEEALAQVDE